MKKTMLLLALMVLVIMPALSQNYTAINTTFVLSTTDTSAWVAIDPLDPVAFSYWADDSCNTRLVFQYMNYNSGQGPGATNALAQAGDFLTVATAAGDTVVNVHASNNVYKSYTLRDVISAVRIPSGANYVRCLAISLSTGNGKTTPNHKAWFARRSPHN